MSISGAIWRKSTYSSATGSNCVEVGPTDRIVRVRDTKNRNNGALAVSPATWSAFIRSLKGNRL